MAKKSLTKTKKFKRCVSKVKRGNKVRSPYAICQATMRKKKAKK